MLPFLGLRAKPVVAVVAAARTRSDRPNMDAESINAVLPHYTEGPIVKGFGRGATELGFPTANYPEEVIASLPSQLVGGIYWGLAQVDRGQVHDMVMSIGWNPFYENKQRAMETHIVHTFPEPELYGKTLRVIILGYLRAEQSYDSLEALKEAIRNDISSGRENSLLEQFCQYRKDPVFLPLSD